MAGAKQLLQLTWFNKDKALIPSEEGRYAYEWVDPKDPRYCETRALVVDEVVTGEQSPKDEGTQYSERADLEPTDDNLLILGESGDVLEALTRVPELREKYLGKVKCIYIDPPFNTAQTFANYEDNLEHSVWLTMMRDRLVHLRKLLSDDGSIWVHLDDVENHRMRVLMDEVFGSGNFVAEVVWEGSPGTKGKAAFALSHNVVLVYAKNKEKWSKIRNLLDRTDAQLRRFANPDNDPRGPWRQGADGTAKSGGADARWPITLPSGRKVTPAKGRYWAFSKNTFEIARKEGRVYFGSNGDRLPFIKTYLADVQGGTTPHTWWSSDEVGSSQEGKRDHLNKLLPDEEPFDTPKPERLIERVLQIATDPGDVVMDIFAGSGTTASTAQKMGRRWVVCELLESVFERYTKPRLQMVVNDDDEFGITYMKGREPLGGVTVPDKFDPEDLQKAAKLLRAVRATKTLSIEENVAVKQTLKLIATRPSTVRNWRGGGGFKVAHLAPQCFDYVPELGLVTLTEAATGATLVNSVAANLNFSLTPDNRHFDGKRGSMFLKVVEGRLDREKVEELLSHLGESEGVTLAATELEPGIRQFARTTDKPCQVVHIPNDIFTYSATQEGK